MIIEIIRESGQRRDKLSRYRVMLDSKQAGEIYSGQTLRINCDQTEATIALKSAWCRSPYLTLSGTASEVIGLKCEPNGGSWSTLFFMTIGMHRYIKLTRIPS